MKAKVLRGINVLLTAILGLFGFSSCFSVPVAYGVPHTDFTIEGTVSNEDNEPLQNIQVVQKGGEKDGDGNTYWEEWPDTLYTDADGKFYRYYAGDFPLAYRKLVVNDTTGVYASDSIDTSVTYSGGDGHWYSGKGKLKADFVLVKKADND